MLGAYLLTFLIVRFALRRSRGVSALTGLAVGGPAIPFADHGDRGGQTKISRQLIPLDRHGAGEQQQRHRVEQDHFVQ